MTSVFTILVSKKKRINRINLKKWNSSNLRRSSVNVLKSIDDVTGCHSIILLLSMLSMLPMLNSHAPLLPEHFGDILFRCRKVSYFPGKIQYCSLSWHLQLFLGGRDFKTTFAILLHFFYHTILKVLFLSKNSIFLILIQN